MVKLLLLLLCIVVISALEVEDTNYQSSVQEFQSLVESLKAELQADADKKYGTAAQLEWITTVTKNNSELQTRVSELEQKLTSHRDTVAMMQTITNLQEDKIRYLGKEKEHALEISSQRLQLEQVKKMVLEEETKNLKLQLTESKRKLEETESGKQEADFEIVRLKRENRNLSIEIQRLREDQEDIKEIIANKTAELQVKSNKIQSALQDMNDKLQKSVLNVMETCNSNVQLIQECNGKYEELSGDQLKIKEDVMELFNYTKIMSNEITELHSATKTCSTVAEKASTSSVAAQSVAIQARQKAEESEREIENVKTNAGKAKETADLIQIKYSEAQKKLEKMELAIQYLLVNDKAKLTELGDSRYHFHVGEKMSWSDASRFCSSHHMRLAMIETKEENDFLKNHMQKLGKADMWIGGTDQSVEGRWIWSPDGQKVQFTNWDHVSGEPNGGQKENCVELRKSGGWNDRFCNFENVFICELRTEFKASNFWSK